MEVSHHSSVCIWRHLNSLSIKRHGKFRGSILFSLFDEFPFSQSHMCYFLKRHSRCKNKMEMLSKARENRWLDQELANIFYKELDGKYFFF